MRKVLVIENWEDRGGDIVRLVETTGHVALMVRPYAGEPLPAPAEFDAVVLSGGPMSIHDRGQPVYAFLSTVMEYLDRLIGRSIPCLGICLGHQILAAVLGGRVETMASPDVGIRAIHPVGTRGRRRLGGFESFVFHRDHVVEVPPGCAQTFTSDGCTVEGFRHRTKPLQGVQFHPEVPSVRAVDVLTRWRSEADGHQVTGDPSAFDGRDAQSAFGALVAELFAQRRIA